MKSWAESTPPGNPATRNPEWIAWSQAPRGHENFQVFTPLDPSRCLAQRGDHLVHGLPAPAADPRPVGGGRFRADLRLLQPRDRRRSGPRCGSRRRGRGSGRLCRDSSVERSVGGSDARRPGRVVVAVRRLRPAWKCWPLSPPFETKRWMSQDLGAMRGTIPEKEPLRPSTRILSH